MGNRFRFGGAIIGVLLVLMLLIGNQVMEPPKPKSLYNSDSIAKLLSGPCSTDAEFLNFTNHPYNELLVSNTSSISPQLLYSVMWCESRMNRLAVSPAGANGLMQLMPCIYEPAGIDPFNPEQNVVAGAAFLEYLISRYNCDIWRAVAAYNCGPGNTDRVQGIPKIEETQKYVKAVRKKYWGKNAK